MAEKEYIEREAVVEAIMNQRLYYTFGDPNSNQGAYNMVKRVTLLDAVKRIPAADVRPVVRGKWVNDHNGKYSASGDNFFCSICKDPSLRAFGKPAKTNYCPNCGADMREAEEGE